MKDNEVIEDSHVNKKRLKKHRKHMLSTTSVVLLGFLCAIVIGTILLILPCSSASGEWTAPLDALFTSTTSVCVTGLVVVPTYSYWSLFGQIVILILIQCGGLGIVTFTTMIMMFIGRKVNLRDRMLIEDAFNLSTLSGLVRFLRKVVIITLSIEAVGALGYMTVFVKEYGPKGIWISVFNSISAFCNAGIDIIGDSSLMPYANNVTVNVITMMLIIAGGIGFVVYLDFINVYKRIRKGDLSKKHFFNHLKLHTKVVLTFTGILILFGAVMFFVFEYSNDETMGNMPLGNKVMASFFQSVTVRTAGYATVSQKGLTGSSAFAGMLLMFIGGSSVGTAGGVKTGTIAVLLLAAKSMIKGENEPRAYGRKIPLGSIYKALTVVMVTITVLFVATISIVNVENLEFIDGAYETVSALGTVGLTRDITPTLGIYGRVVLIICMYLGRVGPVTMAIVFARKKRNGSLVSYPEGDITVG